MFDSPVQFFSNPAARTSFEKKKHEKQLNLSISPDCGLFWVSVVMLGFPSMKNSGLSHAKTGLRIPINPCILGSFLVAGLACAFILNKPHCGSPGRQH